MPAPEQNDRCQKALLFEVVGVDEFNEPLISDPIELDVRWVWKATQMPGPNGNPVRVDSTVILDREVPIGSTMVESTLEDWYGTGSAEGQHTIMEVVAMGITPDIKNRNVRYVGGLAYFKETQAELAD